MSDDLVYDVAITLLRGVEPRTIIELIEEFGAARTLFKLSVDELTSRGLAPSLVEAIQNRNYLIQAQQTIEICRLKQVKILVRGKSNLYPQLLEQCYDAPHILYQYGNININDYRTISIVGTRKASEDGLNKTAKLVTDLAKSYSDIAIVSGLAFGVDYAAHSAAIDNNVPTIAILPGWVLRIQPQANTELARNIIRSGGAILSDKPYQYSVEKVSFLSRNRIVAGISAATILVESPQRGGSLNTAALAYSYDRAVFAMPGRLGDANSYGTNTLIKTSRAQLYEEISDIALELGWQRENLNEATSSNIGELHGNVQKLYYEFIAENSGEFTAEELVEASSYKLYEVISMLLELELRGVVKSCAGGYYSLVRF